MIACMILGWAPCWMKKLCKEMEKARKLDDELHSTIVSSVHRFSVLLHHDDMHEY